MSADLTIWMHELLAKPYARDLFGVELVSAAPGAVVLALAHRPAFAHAPGWFEGAITSAVGQFAASYSAMTFSDRDWQHFTLSQSVNFVGPARGERLVAEGRVISSGRSISVAAAEVYVAEGAERRLCATLTLTMRHAAPRA